MFSNLQNRIDLKRIKEGSVVIDHDFVLKEEFDIVSKTLTYFEKKKNEPNNISIREEVNEYEDEDIFNFLDDSVDDEQKFIYNNEEIVNDAVSASDEEDVQSDSINESYSRHHKKKSRLAKLLHESNENLKTDLKQYVLMDGELDDVNENDYGVDALFDKEVINMARQESLDHIYTMNWLEKQLIEYRNQINKDLSMGGKFQIDNQLKKLDVNDSDEIKNKIKDLNESIKILKSKKMEEK